MNAMSDESRDQIIKLLGYDAMSETALLQLEDALSYVQKVCPKLSKELQLAVAAKVVAELPKHTRKG